MQATFPTLSGYIPVTLLSSSPMTAVSAAGPLAFMAWNPGSPPPAQGFHAGSPPGAQREEQRLGSSRKGSGRVNTGQMLLSLFRDPVY